MISIIAFDIYSFDYPIMFTLPLQQWSNRLLLLIQRYMRRNHVVTWSYANNSGRNLDFQKLGFRICIIFCNITFGLDLNLKNVSLYGIWKRLKAPVWGPLPWTRYANTRLH